MLFRKKILTVFGTRPEAIKMVPLIKELDKSGIENKVCVTGQHREMLDQVLDFFRVSPDYDLNLMTKGQSLAKLTSRILLEFSKVLEDFKPDIVLVHGDTTTSMVAALTAFYHNIQVGHIEAGLRTNDISSPFPEELNRQITGRISSIHFAVTERNRNNLLLENIESKKIYVVGNTVIDALFLAKKLIKPKELNIFPLVQSIQESNKKIILVTAHRRENQGSGFESICNALISLSKDRDDIAFIFPVHLNPKTQEIIYNKLQGLKNIYLISPLSYPEFIYVMENSHIILSDSGGIQEEAPSLNKPVLVLRENTERVEAVEAGTAKLIGTNSSRIVESVNELLDNEKNYSKMSTSKNPYGDGLSAKKIIEIIQKLEL